MRKIFILAAAMLALTSTAFAQLNTPLFCGDLSEMDCAIITSTQIPESASFSGDGTLIVTTEGTPVDVSLAMDGSYIADTAFFDDLQAQVADGDFAALFETVYADTDSFLTFMSDYFTSVESDMTLTVNLPEEMTGGMLPSPLAVDLWLVDGVAYADIGAFSFIDPTLEGVYGFDLPGFYEELFSSEEMASFMDQMFESQGDGMVASFMDPSFMASYATLTRLDDETTADGQTLAVFETSIDYAALFTSDAMREMMQSQIDAQMDMMEDMGEDAPTEEEMEAMFEGILDAYALAFENTAFTTVQKIGLDDGYVHETEVDLFMDIDTNAVSNAMLDAAGDDAVQEGFESPELEPIVIDFSMTITQGEFGTVESISLPDGAQVLPMDALGIQ